MKKLFEIGTRLDIPGATLAFPIDKEKSMIEKKTQNSCR